MLSYLDPIIFPDDCEVLQLEANRYVYPIFKNGSSTLHALNLKRVSDLSSLEVIDVIIREPYERFYSGVNTYIQHLDSSLDKNTALFFINNYLFLNRHFCPQFYWLVNLKRFTDAKFRLLSMTALSDITTMTLNKTDVDKSLKNKFSDKLDFYLQMDKILYEDLIGKTVSFEEILNALKLKYPHVYKEVVNRTKELCNVLD